MESTKKRIYISAMESCAEPKFSPSAIELMNRLAEEGYLIFWEKKFRDYSIILDDIEASDALLAIKDETWGGSIWMAIETSHALGHGSWGNRINPNPIPTFLYPLTTRKIWIDYFVEKHPNVITILDLDIEKAVSQIMAKLSE